LDLHRKWLHIIHHHPHPGCGCETIGTDAKKPTSGVDGGGAVVAVMVVVFMAEVLVVIVVVIVVVVLGWGRGGCEAYVIEHDTQGDPCYDHPISFPPNTQAPLPSPVRGDASWQELSPLAQKNKKGGRVGVDRSKDMGVCI